MESAQCSRALGYPYPRPVKSGSSFVFCNGACFHFRNDDWKGVENQKMASLPVQCQTAKLAGAVSGEQCRWCAHECSPFYPLPAICKTCLIIKEARKQPPIVQEAALAHGYDHLVCMQLTRSRFGSRIRPGNNKRRMEAHLGHWLQCCATGMGQGVSEHFLPV